LRILQRDDPLSVAASEGDEAQHDDDRWLVQACFGEIDSATWRVLLVCFPRATDSHWREEFAAWQKALTGDGDSLDRAKVQKKIDAARKAK